MVSQWFETCPIEELQKLVHEESNEAFNLVIAEHSVKKHVLDVPIAEGLQYGDIRETRIAAVNTLRVRQKSVYGTDDRVDVCKVSNKKVKENAKSVACILGETQLNERGDGMYMLSTQMFGDAYNLCENEPFRNQPCAKAVGTAFLVGTNIVITAGHCINPNEFKNKRFVFGFTMGEDGGVPSAIASCDIYWVDKVLEYQYNPKGADWAIVKLDRDVEGRQPLTFRREGQIQDNQSVYVIGHPCGLPQKYAGNAIVRNNQAATHFVANLDVYGGNSGSPVFNDSTNEVEGILVRGDLDFVRREKCYVSLVWPTTGGQGEECTRVTQFSSLIY